MVSMAVLKVSMYWLYYTNRGHDNRKTRSQNTSIGVRQNRTIGNFAIHRYSQQIIPLIGVV